MKREAEAGRIDDFNFIEINCLSVKTPADAYTVLWRLLTGYNVPSRQALVKLREYYRDQGNDEKAASERTVTVCLVDELDYLITRDYQVRHSVL